MTHAAPCCSDDDGRDDGRDDGPAGGSGGGATGGGAVPWRAEMLEELRAHRARLPESMPQLRALCALVPEAKQRCVTALPLTFGRLSLPFTEVSLPAGMPLSLAAWPVSLPPLVLIDSILIKKSTRHRELMIDSVDSADS